jgi:hypothetical protein
MLPDEQEISQEISRTSSLRKDCMKSKNIHNSSNNVHVVCKKYAGMLL